MIDWVSFRAEVEPHEPISGGRVARFTPDGEVEWSVNTRLAVEGSFSEVVQVRSLSSTELEVSGNLVKFFQGHNLWGTGDLPALIEAWDRYAFVRGLPMILGEITLTRVDVTYTYNLADHGQVLAWLRWAAQSAHLAHRGRGTLYSEGTVYWGQGSRRSSLKAYCKHLEVVRHKAAKEGEPLFEISKGLLRVEATIRGLELERLNLRRLTEWKEDSANMVYMKLLERLNLPERAPGESLLDVLPRHLKGVYAEWLHGRDPRAIYPRRTAYRYRQQLLPFGVDIFVPCTEPSKVGSWTPTDMTGWDIRKLEPWQPTPEQIAALGWFEPNSYRPARHQS